MLDSLQTACLSISLKLGMYNYGGKYIGSGNIIGQRALSVVDCFVFLCKGASSSEVGIQEWTFRFRLTARHPPGVKARCGHVTTHTTTLKVCAYNTCKCLTRFCISCSIRLDVFNFWMQIIEHNKLVSAPSGVGRVPRVGRYISFGVRLRTLCRRKWCHWPHTENTRGRKRRKGTGKSQKKSEKGGVESKQAGHENQPDNMTTEAHPPSKYQKST